MPSGAFRRVILIGDFAIKIPHFHNILSGLRCNRWEREMWYKWRPLFEWEHLCPIKFADPFGVIVVMPRAQQPVSDENTHEAFIDYYPNINAETKAENFGKIGSHVLVLDYGISDSSSIKNQRDYYQKHANKPAIKL
jgi:hypothetical protein